MDRTEVILRLRTGRAAFDGKVAAVPSHLMAEAPPGSSHAPKDIVAHVSAYEELILERIRAGRRGETTAFDRDRDGWEAFNDRIWTEAAGRDTDEILTHSAAVFDALLEEVGRLSDDELSRPVGVTAAVDPGWLHGRSLWEMIGVDAFDHYPMHLGALEAAAQTSG